MSSLSLFQQYLPAAAIGYCHQLWQENDFEFVLSPRRESKLGDYRYDPATGHRITVNENLNPYHFLITYLHEVAHYKVLTTYKRRKAPHGKEWKKIFANLMQPMLNETVFPEEVLTPLRQYMHNPAASSCHSLPLASALHKYSHPEGKIMLSELPAGAGFLLGNRHFLRREKRRTRYLCEEVSTRRRYVIAATALVVQAES
jgi:SprT protein